MKRLARPLASRRRKKPDQTLAAWLFTAALVLGLLGSGCATSPGPPEKGELLTPDGKPRAVLLVRITTEVDGQPATAFSSMLPEDNIWLGLEDFSTGVTATPAELRFLSGETRKEGWTYLLLEPGLHYLAAHEPQSTNVFAYDARWSTCPRWSIEIPNGARVIYGGTLFLPGTGRTMILGPRQLVTFDPARLEIRDETSAAQALARQWFPNLTPMSVQFLKGHKLGDTIIIETPVGK